MELKHIDIAKLCISSANMRAKGKPDLSHILPSIRARGVLVPLIVRPAEAEDQFEIVAGKRRYHAALAVAEEGGVGKTRCPARSSRRATTRRRWKPR
jgi:ParB family chromosome partitioning protein